MADLLTMDYAALAYIAEHGPLPSIAIPARLFAGEVPKGSPNLVDLGLIEHVGELTSITAAGRDALVRKAA